MTISYLTVLFRAVGELLHRRVFCHRQVAFRIFFQGQLISHLLMNRSLRARIFCLTFLLRQLSTFIMRSCQCSNHPDKFCCICGRLTFEQQRILINENVMSLYKKYFEFPVSHQDRPWALHIVCASCYTALNRWNNAVAKVTPMPSKTPMIWREPSSHDDCYFCLTNVTGFNSKNSNKIKYANVRSITKPVLYEAHDKFPIPPLMKEKKESNEVAYIF